MTTHSTPPDPPPQPIVHHSSFCFGLSAADMRLQTRDAHGAAHIYLDEDGDIGIRIQLETGRYITPERHAAELERDRQGLLRLAELATQLAEEIGQIQQQGAGQ